MPKRLAPWAALLGFLLSACDVNIHEGKASVRVFSAEATEEWARKYPLPSDGRVEIANLNGPIELTAGSNGFLEVHAGISAKALTESAARDMLSKGRIAETVSPKQVKVETVVPRGIRGSYQVSYHVAVPPGADAVVSTTNGALTAAGLNNTLKATVVNGSVDLTDMNGALDAVCVNGSLSVKFRKVSGPIRLEMTNGRLSLDLPQTTQANLSARAVNGGLSISGLTVNEPRGTRIRTLEASLNGGGPAIDLRTTNGRLTIRGIP